MVVVNILVTNFALYLREEREKFCNMKRTREEMDAFLAAQQIWKDRARRQVEDEDRKIKEYIKEKLEVERKR